MQLYGKLAQNWQEKRQKDKPQTLSTLRVRRWTRVCRRKLIEEQNSLEHLVHLSSCTFGGENNGQPGRSARFKETKMHTGLFVGGESPFAYPTTPQPISQLNRIPAFDRTYIFQSHHLPLQQPERSQQQRPGPSWIGFGWTWGWCPSPFLHCPWWWHDWIF